MTWIQTVEGQQASGPLKALYEGVKQQMGMVPNIVKTSNLKPNSLKALVGLIGEVMFGESGLSRMHLRTL